MTIKELVEKAKGFQRDGKKWHFHMLTPDCMFNQRKNKHAFVLENTTDSEVFVTYSEKRYMKEGQDLVKLIHGESILEDKETGESKEDESIKIMLERARELARSISQLPQGAIRSDKESVLRGIGRTLEERLRIEAEHVLSMFMRKDSHRLGAGSFVGKKTPEWKHHGL